MVKTVTFNTEIPADRELRITLPADVPAGSAAVVITVSSPGPSTASTFGDWLNSEFFGMWHDRDDIEDTLQFAQKLRSRGWKRPA